MACGEELLGYRGAAVAVCAGYEDFHRGETNSRGN